MRKPALIVLTAFLLISVVCLPAFAQQKAGQIFHQSEAEALNKLGLLLGSPEGFELDRTPTRAEGSVMLVRLLGREKEAKEANYVHPFTDVPEWLNPYVGFLYHNKLTTGVGNNLFDPNSKMDANSFTTFILRALGYSDKEGDFSWDKALEKALSLNIIDESYKKLLSEKTFLRDDMVAISYNALTALIKRSNITLAEKLLQENAISHDAAKEIKLLDRIASKPKLTKVTFSDMVKYPFGDIAFTITIDRSTLPEKMRDFDRIVTGGGDYFNNTTMWIAQRGAYNDNTSSYESNVKGDTTVNKWAVYNGNRATCIGLCKGRTYLGYAVITEKIYSDTTLYLEFKEVTEPEYLEEITAGISIDGNGLIHINRNKLPDEAKNFNKIYITNAFAEQYPTVEELDILNTVEAAPYFYPDKIFDCKGTVFNPGGVYTSHFNKENLIIYLLDENNNALGYYRVKDEEADRLNSSMADTAINYMNEYKKQNSIAELNLEEIFYFTAGDNPNEIEISNELIRLKKLNANIKYFAVIDAPAGMPDDYFLYKFLKTPDPITYNLENTYSTGYGLGDSIKRQSLMIILLDKDKNIVGYYRPDSDQFRPRSEYYRTFTIEVESDLIFDSLEDTWTFISENFIGIRKVDGETDTRYQLTLGGTRMDFDNTSEKGKAAEAMGKIKLSRIVKEVLIPDNRITFDVISKDKNIKFRVYSE